MNILLLPACSLAALVAGYGVGRFRPALRLANWAAWEAYGPRTGASWRIAWLVLQADALVWITSHPVQTHAVWHRRDDPPPAPRPPRSDPRKASKELS